MAAKPGRKSKQLQRGPVPSEVRGSGGRVQRKHRKPATPTPLSPEPAGAPGRFCSQTPPARAQGAWVQSPPGKAKPVGSEGRLSPLDSLRSSPTGWARSITPSPAAGVPGEGITGKTHLARHHRQRRRDRPPSHAEPASLGRPSVPESEAQAPRPRSRSHPHLRGDSESCLPDPTRPSVRHRPPLIPHDGFRTPPGLAARQAIRPSGQTQCSPPPPKPPRPREQPCRWEDTLPHPSTGGEGAAFTLLPS